MRDKRKKRLSGPAEQIAQILPAVGRQMNLDKKVQEWSVLSLWEKIIDAPFRGKTQALKIKSTGNRNSLLVKAANAAVAAELTFYLETYQNRINAFTPQTGLVIHRIEIYTG